MKFLLLLCLLCIGSSASAQWQVVAPNLLGEVKDFAGGAMTYSNGTLFIGSNTFFVSTDDGNTWSKRSSPNASVEDLAFFNRNIGIAGTTDGAFLTIDGGNSWVRVVSGIECRSVAFLGSEKDIVVAGVSPGGVLISRDQGKTWSASRIGEWVHQVIPLGAGRMLALAGPNNYTPTNATALFETQDYGVTWSQKPLLLEHDCFSIATDSCTNNRIYLINEDAASSSDGLSQLYVSTDHGTSWITSLESQKNTLTGAFASTTDLLFLPTKNGFRRSQDHGMTWSSIGGPYLPYDSRLTVAAKESLLFAVDSNGSVWRWKEELPPTTFRTHDIEVDTIGEMIAVPILGDHITSEQEVIIYYDTTSLVYQGTYSTHRERQRDSSASGKVCVFFDPVYLHQSDSVLGYAHFEFYPVKEPCSEVILTTRDIGVHPNSCLPIGSSVSRICTTPSCALHYLANFMRYGNVPEIDVYPNPAAEHTIIVSHASVESASIIVTDISGRSLLHQRIDLLINSPMKLNTSALSPGMYFITIKNDAFKLNYPLYIVR